MTIDHVFHETITAAVTQAVNAAFRAHDARGTLAVPVDAYLSVSEAARLAGVHQATIRGWINSGQLGGHRAGRHHRIKQADLVAFLARVGTSGVMVNLDERAAELAQQ